MTEGKIFAIDLGGSKISATLFDSNGSMLDKYYEPTENRFLDQLARIYNHCRNKWGPLRIVSIGVPGPVKNGIMESSFPLGVFEATNFEPCFNGVSTLILKNDLFMALYAELKEGVGRQSDNFLLISMSTGIGIGVVINGDPLDIRSEMGHQMIVVPGLNSEEHFDKPRSWAGYCSGRALALLDNEYDVSLIKKINCLAFYNLILAYDPDCISIMGGVGINMFDQIIPGKTDFELFDKIKLPKISKSQLGREIGVTGAHLFAVDTVNG